MRLTTKLVPVAAIVAAAAAATAGCSSSSGGCTREPGPTTVTITSAQACQMIEEPGDLAYNVENGSPFSGTTCTQVCGNEPFRLCTLPASYVSQAHALNPDAGVSLGDGGLLALDCPAGPATLTVTCSAQGCP